MYLINEIEYNYTVLYIILLARQKRMLNEVMRIGGKNENNIKKLEKKYPRNGGRNNEI